MVLKEELKLLHTPLEMWWSVNDNPNLSKSLKIDFVFANDSLDRKTLFNQFFFKPRLISFFHAPSRTSTLIAPTVYRIIVLQK